LVQFSIGLGSLELAEREFVTEPGAVATGSEHSTSFLSVYLRVELNASWIQDPVATAPGSVPWAIRTTAA